MTPFSTATDTPPTAGACDCAHTANPLTADGIKTSDVTPALVSAGTTLLHIPTMDCPVEESDIRRALADIAGIHSITFQLSDRTLALAATPSALPDALQAIRKAGYTPTIIENDAALAPGHDRKFELYRAIAALVLASLTEALTLFTPHSSPNDVLGMALAAVAIGLAGISTYTKGISALRRGQLNMNALMGVAVTGAFLIGQWPEAAMVMALYAIAELIEARSADRARNAIKGLLDLTPDTAELRQEDGTWQEVSTKEVALASVVRVKPGARIPLDGRVVAGMSAVNQAPVTGESLPVDKRTGDAVFAGTINETGLLEIQVTAAADNTTLARIIHAVEQAQGTRAPTQRFIDRFATVYTPAVFILAVAVATLTPLLLGWTWSQAIYKALVLLVIACPCALVLATPITIVSGLAAAARRGILIKGGAYLEAARLLKVVALDKTGTVTEGKPRLVATEVLTSKHSQEQVLLWAASLSSHSDHPVSQAIAIGLAQPSDGLTDVVALPGRGIEASAQGQRLTLGNHRLIEEREICSPQIEARLDVHESQGRSVTLLATDSEVLAIFAVADTIKESSRAAIADLHTLKVATVMLTGDNVKTAQTIGRQAGIADVRGNLLPEDKLAAIEDLRAGQGHTAMCGDGINDAPALARADIGIAMGGAGTDIAMEAADIVIMNDDLRRIPETIRLSRRTHTILWQNITLALGIKAVFLGLAIFGNASMWMAVFADMGASLIVVANGLRMLKGASSAHR
jgi:Cd2+/Zn2+-exporting ATPase